MTIVKAKRAEFNHRPGYVGAGGLEISEAIVEIGTPYEPESTLLKSCGTDLVWPVLRVIEPKGVELRGGRVVCRHEIEAGD